MPLSSRRSSTTTNRRPSRRRVRGNRDGGKSAPAARARRAIGLLLVITTLLTAIILLIPTPPNRAVDSENVAPDATLDTVPSPPHGDARSIESANEQDAINLPPRPLPSTEANPITGVLAIVIDDVGNNLGELSLFLDLPGPLTFAVLPHLAQSAAAAALAREAGHEVILHAPMEADGGRWPGPGTITVEHELLDVWSQLANSFESIAGASGANNHMGSRLTADPIAMDAVMAYLGATDRFFLDSRTTASTVAEEFARAHNVPFLRRDVFLDNVREIEAIASAFEEGVALAASGGQATVIGHAASSDLATYLERRIPSLQADGVALVGIAYLAQRDTAVATPPRE